MTPTEGRKGGDEKGRNGEYHSNVLQQGVIREKRLINDHVTMYNESPVPVLTGV